MNKLGLILVCILILALAYFAKIGVNEKPDRLIRHVEVISPKQKDIYKVGDTITIHLSNPSDIPNDSLQLVFIVGEDNGFAVKNGLKAGIDTDFKFVIPKQSCGEDDCKPVVTGKYRVSTKIYSRHVFELSCINSLYCAYPDSDLVAYGQSGEFTIASSYQ